MVKNVGFVDRLIRFVAVDLLLGFSFLGTNEDPVVLSSIAFVMSVIIAIPILTGYSGIYALLKISTIYVPILEKDKVQV